MNPSEDAPVTLLRSCQTLFVVTGFQTVCVLERASTKDKLDEEVTKSPRVVGFYSYLYVILMINT